MDFHNQYYEKRSVLGRCWSSKVLVKLRKILITTASIYYLLYQLKGYLCPDQLDVIQSYHTTDLVIQSEYVPTMEKYLMNNSEFYHLTQVFSYNQKNLDDRFHHLLRFHYTHFVELENTKDWDADLIAEIKRNFTRSISNPENSELNADQHDPYRIDKVILYEIQEMVAFKHDYHTSFFLEIGMTDLLRNYSSQALIIWYHWRGMVLETDLVSLQNYASQPVHPMVLCTAAICTEDRREFHYVEVNRMALRHHVRSNHRALYRVPCFHLDSFSFLFRSDHIEYFIIGPRIELLSVLKAVVKQRNVHCILVILNKGEVEEGKLAKEMLQKENFSLYYNTHEESLNFEYLLFFKFIKRKREFQNYGITLKKNTNSYLTWPAKN